MQPGYYRFPTIYRDQVVFVSEDDLWSVSAKGGVARRLTSGLAESTRPAISPDGSHLAFTGREEGQPEIYLMPAKGGPARRLTFLGGTLCWTVGWTGDGEVVFANNAGQPFSSLLHLYKIGPEEVSPQLINVGPARAISVGPQGGMVIGRNIGSPARWKRYRGGTAGQLWIDESGDGNFRPLIAQDGNLASPMWLGERIFFLSDHQGIGNLYSCKPDGLDLKRHTDHESYYARNATSDSQRIIYHAGADLFVFDPEIDKSEQVNIEFHSPRTQRNRKFVSAAKFLEGWKLHPDGHSLAITSRGKAFTFANWEEAVFQHGQADGPRYRLFDWLNDVDSMIAITDIGGEESFVRIYLDPDKDPELFEGLDIGRPIDLAVNPKRDEILFSNHRYELYLLDLESRELQLIDRGKEEMITGFSWSPDGEWVAYSISVSIQVTVLKLWQRATGETFQITRPVLRDVAPSFDPQGKYLYFLSYRHFDPVYDNLHFDLNFPRGVHPYLITLRDDLPSPFVPVPRPPGEKIKPDAQNNNVDITEEKDTESQNDRQEENGDEESNDKEKLTIDIDGIDKRIVAFPVVEGRYGRILGIKDGRVLYTRFPVEGALNQDWLAGTPPANRTLFIYDFNELKEESFISSVSDFDLSRDRASLVYRAGNRLRVLKAGAKPDKSSSARPGRKSGWIDLTRVKVSVAPGTEWRQMYREIWRLQRDQFWTPDMSQVDWLTIYERYLPLLERVSSRSEFSDLIWEMQGELGTSHCYEIGGDYRPEPKFDQGFLAASFDYDDTSNSWRIDSIVQGDPWDDEVDSPFNKPGIRVKAGDQLLAINGRRLSRERPPATALVSLAAQSVTLTIRSSEDTAADDNKSDIRSITLKTLKDEMPARYRQWVERNRSQVHEATNGQVGYVHIPDMGARGYAEFHRGYLAEVDRTGLIVDVRFNGGGHVSELILEKLARRRIAYNINRWGKEPLPYPEASVLGPIVALTNEQSGSDGDIFSHNFKLMKLGPLIGTRTWGGVIGIWPRHMLVDGTVTTQPEFSFWFQDVGWDVENYGTDPDIEIDNRPQDYAMEIDAQLERAITEVLELLKANPPELPSLNDRPSRALPKLPKR